MIEESDVGLVWNRRVIAEKSGHTNKESSGWDSDEDYREGVSFTVETRHTVQLCASLQAGCENVFLNDNIMCASIPNSTSYHLQEVQQWSSCCLREAMIRSA